MKVSKLLSATLTVSMITAVFAGCGSGDGGASSSASSGGASSASQAASSAASSSAPSEAQKAEPTGDVRMIVSVTGGKDDEEMKLFEQKLSEATGLNVTMEKPPSDYDNILMQKLSGGEQYDLVYGSYNTLAAQGALMDITEYVKNSDILSGNIDPQEWADITIDGKIYGGFNKKEVHRVVALNKNMLEAAGIDYKTIDPTLDGYYNVFKALREKNTEKDFYPLNAVLKDVFDIQPWMASAGLKSGIVLDTDGKKYAPYATDAAAPVWEWFKKLYDESLLDPASFVDQTKDMRGKMGAASKKTACTVDWAMWVGLHNANALAEGITADAFEIVSLPGVKTPDGNYMLVKGGASVFGVPANAKNVDGAIKVLEYFATQEGGELLSVGIEGHDYTKEGDKYVHTEVGAKHADDHGAPCPIFKDFKHPIGYNPGVEEALSYGQYAGIEMAIPDNSNYTQTVGKWGIQIIKGEIPALDGLAKMREELLSLGVTEK